MTEKIGTRFTAPLYSTVHFHRKVVKHRSGESFDHEAICFSSPVDIDHYQFLGAPELDFPTVEITVGVSPTMFKFLILRLKKIKKNTWEDYQPGIDQPGKNC